MNHSVEIELLALDVDGVLTDGSITYTSAGEELKTFNIKDGYGIKKVAQVGIQTAIITARNSPMVERRAQELGIHHLIQGCSNKWEALEALLKELNIAPEKVAYMGDDVIDLQVLQHIGLPACPADAVDEVQSACVFKSRLPGGKGAVRELCDYLSNKA